MIYPPRSTELTVAQNVPETSTSQTKNRLRESFSAEFSQDLASKNPDEPPKPIYIEVETTNNPPNNIVADSQDLFATRPKTSFREDYNFLATFSFYKSWLLMATLKYSGLVFWVFFPTYLYFEMDQLKVKQTTFLVGCMGLGSLFFGMFSAFMPVGGMKRQNTIAGFCFLGSVGFFSTYVISIHNRCVIFVFF